MNIDFDILKSILETIILEFGVFDEITGEMEKEQLSVIHDVVAFADEIGIFSEGYHQPEPAADWDVPPVGTICEFRSTGGSLNHGEQIDWLNCEVIATTRAYAILRHIGVAYSDDHECSHNLRHIEFRPIRTKAERDKEILERIITNALRECHYSASDEDVSRKISGVILTDGWQKPENN